MARNQQHPLVTLLDHPRSGWQARWLEQGSQKQVTLSRLGITSKVDRIRFAKEISARLVAERRASILGLPEVVKMQLQQAIDHRLQGYAGASHKNQAAALGALSDWLLKPLHLVTDRDLVRFRDHVETATGAPSSKQLRRQIVGSFLSWCRDRGYVPRVSDDGIRKLTVAGTTRVAKQIDILTPEEVRGLLDWIGRQEARWDDLVRFLLFSGCRISEACAIDFDRDVLPDAVRLRAEITKTRESRDVTFACSPMLKQLAERLQGQPFHAKQSGFRQMVMRAKRAGHPFTAHTLRRTCASVLLNSGLLPPLLAAKRMGHSISMMESTYAGLIRPSLLKSGKSLEQVLGL